MKVSIIIPVYNVEKYIIRCLDSVCKQTYNDIECILIDDCGTDKSIQIAENYIRCYTGTIQFKMVHHSMNLGLSGARNSGIKKASGEYVYFLDSDDAITPDCIKLLMNLAFQYPDADFVQGNLLDYNGNLNYYAFTKQYPEYCNNKEYLERVMLLEITTSAWNRLIKRRFLIDHNLFFPLGLLHEDMYWVYFLSKHTKAAVFTAKGTYIYYTNENSIMSSVSKTTRIKRLLSRLQAANVYYQDIKQNVFSTSPQRIYLCADLFSCLPELLNLHSPKYWIKYWGFILKIAICNIQKATYQRILFLFILLPPICFFAREKNFSWRIQENIIGKV